VTKLNCNGTQECSLYSENVELSIRQLTDLCRGYCSRLKETSVDSGANASDGGILRVLARCIAELGVGEKAAPDLASPRVLLHHLGWSKQPYPITCQR
jgi:hypothetical protein